MFEAATWRAQNRRHFEILEAVYTQVGLPVAVEWSAETDAHAAAGAVHQIGSHLLSASIGTAVAKNEKASNRRIDKAWRQIPSPGAGAQACVFLTVAVASILTPEIEGTKATAEQTRSLRDLILSQFPLPAEDLQMIERVRVGIISVLNEDLTKEAVTRGGIRDRLAISRAEAALSYRALEMAGIKVDELPAYEPVRGLAPDSWEQERKLEWYLTLDTLGIIWRSRVDDFLGCALEKYGETLALQLTNRALDLTIADEPEWELSPITNDAISLTADEIANNDQQHQRVLTALALGYWLRIAEKETGEGVIVFAPSYLADLEREFVTTDDPAQIIKQAMGVGQDALPALFAPGVQSWAEIIELAELTLGERPKIFPEDGEGEDSEIHAEIRELVLGLGYGLGVTAEALGLVKIRQ